MVSAKNSKQASLYPLPPSLTYAVSFVHWQQQVWTGMEKIILYLEPFFAIGQKVSESMGWKLIFFSQ